MWLRSLLGLISFEQRGSTTIFCDNNGSNTLGKDPSLHKRMKHIDIQYHYVRERVEAKDVLFRHIPGRENPADALTKPLQRPHFEFLQDHLGIVGPSGNHT